MSSLANPEQLKAIEHSGGVLLRAGAGSGKTFVLKEHMIYLTDLWIKSFDHEKNDNETLEDFLTQKYKKLVLMTFTKKAAGELAIRLQKEFSSKSISDSTGQWEVARKCLEKLTVTTIHGFCLKLIKEGFFPHASSDLDLIDEVTYNSKIEELFLQWLELNNPPVEIINDREKILGTMLKIFSDPSLRKSWGELNLEENLLKNSEESLGNLFSLLGFSEVFDYELDIVSLDEFKGKKWFDFLCEFSSLKKQKNEAFELLKELYLFFEKLNFKIPISPRAKGIDEEVKQYYKLVKELSTFIKDNGKGLFLFSENFNESVLPWFKLTHDIFNYIDKNYFNTKGITFSDLEYIVYKGLQDDDVQSEVSKVYDYLIVDEFQDTSYIQLEIISRIIQDDFSRLFCVGDAKQAIYGFRGGELGVFSDCAQKVPQVLSLKNNYRSDQAIIHFNNVFFEYLFEKGLAYQGKEENSVEVEYQEVPLEDRPKGKVCELSFILDDSEKRSLTSADIEELEAQVILSQIEKSNSNEIAILYKKLKPSLTLIEMFLKKDISFTAQVKVKFLEDPVIAIFYHFLEREFNSSEESGAYYSLLLTSILKILGLNKAVEELEELLIELKEQTQYFGLYLSFLKMMSALGISNSNFQNNFVFIENICSLYNDNLQEIYEVLSLKHSDSYSLDFQSGSNPKHIQIMTAHASKGLEFEEVFLGGIYTNAKAFPDTSIFGKYPMSFKWADGTSLKERYKTPQLLLEQEINKRKDFAESKRLFYVACTRAVSTLYWVNFDFGENKFRKQSNSWIEGIKSWKESSAYSAELCESIHLEEKEREEFRSLAKPLFHIDQMGLMINESSYERIIVPELSVTRFATIYDCPRKFYLQNILKLNADDFKQVVPSLDEDFLERPKSVRGSERGTLIHEEISQIILNDFKSSNEELKYYDSYSWIVDKLQEEVENFEFVSESPIKFSLFGHMISGIPDLILYSKKEKDVHEIWDFKTGKAKDGEDSTYHFQLYCYAYALYILGKVEKNQLTKIVLCYIDQENIVEKNVSFDFVESYLKAHWCQVNRPDKTNKEHCESCSFKELCE